MSNQYSEILSPYLFDMSNRGHILSSLPESIDMNLIRQILIYFHVLIYLTCLIRFSYTLPYLFDMKVYENLIRHVK